VILLTALGCSDSSRGLPDGGGSSKQAQIVGLWELAGNAPGVVRRYTKDGEVIMPHPILQGKIVRGTYKVKGDKLITTMGSETSTQTIKSLDAEEMVLEREGETYKWLRRIQR
jgi:uncharacterized protein (TIGR03066 family)